MIKRSINEIREETKKTNLKTVLKSSLKRCERYEICQNRLDRVPEARRRQEIASISNSGQKVDF